MNLHGSRNTWFIWQVSVLVLSIFFVSVASSLVLVWMRNQIASHASCLRAAEMEGSKIREKLDTLNAEIARAHHPEFLKHRIGQLGLDLRPAEQAQIVRLKPERRMPSYYVDYHFNVAGEREASEGADGHLVFYRPLEQ